MKRLFCLAVCWLGMNFSHAQTFNPQLAAMLQDTLDTYVAMISNIKGMSASVYIPGQGYWTGTAGLSYAGNPVSKDMTFGIASNSKLFVSTAMLQLAENDVLSLDDSLHEWLPPYNNVNPNITIRQLLNHTSGISDPIFVSPWMDTIKAHPDRIFTADEVLDWLGAPTFAAGTSYGYSNVNYILAGMIAEAATGDHISKVIRDQILDPLQMDSTFYDVSENEVGEIAHRWWDNVDHHDTLRTGLNSAGGCAGAMFSTASEMAQWYNALFSGQLINQNSLNELSNFGPTSNPNSDYGLGLARETTQGRTYWGHGGSTWGYRSRMIYDTCVGVVVCGLTNSFPSGMEAVSFLLYRAVMNHIPGCAGELTGISELCQGEQLVTYSVPAIPNATSYEWILPSGASGVSVTNSIVLNFDLSALSGDLIVRGVNAYGAGGWASLPIVVKPKPAAPVISQNGNVLSSNAPAGNQWYNSGGMIAGANGQDYVVTQTNDYYCVVTLDGCSSSASNHLQVVVAGISEQESLVVRLYPVPTADQLTIELAGNSAEVPFEILTLQGHVVLNGTINCVAASGGVGKLNISTANFSPGVYLLKLDDQPAMSWKRFVKQ